MISLLAAASGMLTAPAIEPDYGSYPRDAMLNGQSAAALVEIAVDPKGQRLSCVVLTVVGANELGQDICNLQRNARFTPAQSEVGENTYGVVRAFIKYVLAGSEQGMQIDRLVASEITFTVVGTIARRGSRPPQLESARESQIVAWPMVTFDVEALPEVDHDFVDQRVNVAIDPTGTVADCAALKQVDVKAGYGIAACQQLKGMQVTEPLSVDEQPVAHVRALEVRFALSAKSPD
ncbi:TonB family protein [Altererythrobacter arenosus]|uniref:TonB family protein n=1 Tax=Altererythrobacter arenosus TaxID=3032592 RepID=A0ABY8FY34_9SPHN|nr:TonB family protein [Altererythrobacter sp. CAU 1644]WFL78301.1 TonB family protein [Altererythrobacter sp. CAU 1644]